MKWVSLLIILALVASIVYLLRPRVEEPLPRGKEPAVEVIAEGLEVPWDPTFAPEKIFVTERPGRIRIIEDGRLQEDPWLTLDVYSEGEAGLLGIALHPNYSSNGFVYVYHTYEEGGIFNQVLRLVEKNGEIERKTIIDQIPGARIHDGGRIEFGSDGKLYITTGDASRGELAQNRDSLGGKILRINPDGSIPDDNPFPNSPIWSYGHRNPQGLAWHPGTGQLFATEHGSDGHDEVNLIQKGENYGWPEVSGKSEQDFKDPILESGDGTWAPSGCSFYSGKRFKRWSENLFFATLGFSTGEGRRSIHRVALNEAEGIENHTTFLSNQYGRLRAVEEGPTGYLYVTTSNRDGRGSPAQNDDRILRLAWEEA